MAYDSPASLSLPLLEEDLSNNNNSTNSNNTQTLLKNPPPSLSTSTISDFLFLGNNDVPNLSSSVSSLTLNNQNQQVNSRGIDYNPASNSGALNYSNVARPSQFNPPQQSISNRSNVTFGGFNTQVEEQTGQSFYQNQQQFGGLPQVPQQLPQRQYQPPQIASKGIPLPPALTQQQIQFQQHSQQQPPNNQLNAILKLSENYEKFMTEVDQRLSALEKITREILVNQKTQKDFVQQQYNQILTKLNELSESKVGSSTSQTSSPVTTTTTSSTMSTKSYREREKEKEKEQELADAQFAAQLQSQMDQESRSAGPPPPPVEKEEKCPLCSLQFPVSVLEKHCNDVHFNDGSRPTNITTQVPNQDSWFGKLFGGKTETKLPEQPVPPSSAIVRTTSSAALPYQQQYVLAPTYINPQSQQQYLYRTAPAGGQPAPTGYAPATQVYYDSQGNVYNPNSAR